MHDDSLGTRFSGRLQFIALVLLGFIAVDTAHVDTARYTPFMPHGMNGVVQAALIGFLALTGWDAIVVSAEEIERLRRTIPLSSLTSLGISFILYAGLLLIENELIACSSPRSRPSSGHATAGLPSACATGSGAAAGRRPSRYLCCSRRRTPHRRLMPTVGRRAIRQESDKW